MNGAHIVSFVGLLVCLFVVVRWELSFIRFVPSLVGVRERVAQSSVVVVRCSSLPHLLRCPVCVVNFTVVRLWLCWRR